MASCLFCVSRWQFNSHHPSNRNSIPGVALLYRSRSHHVLARRQTPGSSVFRLGQFDSRELCILHQTADLPMNVTAISVGKTFRRKTCPRCEHNDIRRSHRRHGFVAVVVSIFGVVPYRARHATTDSTLGGLDGRTKDETHPKEFLPWQENILIAETSPVKRIARSQSLAQKKKCWIWL